MSIRITGMNSGLDTDAMVKELVSAYEKKGQKYTKAKTKTEWKQEAWATLNNKVKNFFTKNADVMRFSSAYSKKKTTISDDSKASIVASDNAVNGTQTLEINNLARAGYLTGGEITKDGAKISGNTTLADLGYEGGTQSITIGFGKYDEATGSYASTKTFDVSGDLTVNEFAKKVSAAGLNANFDSSTGRLFISSKESGVDNDFNFVYDDAEGSADKSKDVLSRLGLVGASANKIDAENAEIKLNGATFTSNTNTFSINGLTITAKEKTTGTSGVSISTDNDYDAVYDKIKGFLKEYNSLINEIDKLYNADSSKGYEPLTDEEKDAMSDSEIEKWEKKIKDSLLRYDSDLDKIGSTMRNAMLSSFNVNGKTLSLSSFGINTLGYFNAADNEKNAYHIDGDPDDAEKSGEPDKLKAMIASDPSSTAEFFQKLADGLYKSLNKIQSVSDNYTSYGNFYSDKKLQSEYVDQEKQVTKWEDYVAKIEEKYYKQFTAMEKAMSNLQSQQSNLSQLFGG